MIGQETPDIERKVVAILKVLSDSPEPLGGRVISRRLSDFGIELGERAVRYHLKLMDERGLTRPVGMRDGRYITEQGIDELNGALVRDRVEAINAKIELLAYRTSLDLEKRIGDVPINTSLFPKEKFKMALETMKRPFKAGLCVSQLVAVASEGEILGEVTVPPGKVGLATVSSVAVTGALLKAGIPHDSRFGGVLQLRNNRPPRFIELIECAGSSLSPAEIFVAGRMTKVSEAAASGEGKILAHFRELPSPCKLMVENTLEKLKEAGINGVVMIGKPNETICEIPVGFNKIGMILQSGLNPVAAAVEAGIEVINRAMSGVFDFRKLKSFEAYVR
jgi:repressor of nif and glnA expression